MVRNSLSTSCSAKVRSDVVAPRVVVVAGGVETDRRSAHLRDDHELGALDAEHLGDAVQQLAGALADLTRRVQDLGGAVEELVAVGTTLALAGGDLSGEHENHRWDECEGEHRARRQDHQRHDSERRIRGRRDDLEQVRARHLTEIEPALGDRGAGVERDGVDEPAGDDHRRGERDDAVHRERIAWQPAPPR